MGGDALSSITDNNIFSFFHFALKKIGIARKSTKEKFRRPVFHLPGKTLRMGSTRPKDQGPTNLGVCTK
jgi:hypothetical protein